MGRSWNLLKSGSKSKLRRGENASRLLVDEARAELEIPKKHFVVCVGANSRQYVVPLSYLSIPAFRALMDASFEQFGYQKDGPMQLPCEEAAFEELLENLKQPPRRRMRIV